MDLGEKERLLQEVEKERELWRQRDRARATVLQEKEDQIHFLKEELERRQKDEQVIICITCISSVSFSLVPYEPMKVFTNLNPWLNLHFTLLLSVVKRILKVGFLLVLTNYLHLRYEKLI